MLISAQPSSYRHGAISALIADIEAREMRQTDGDIGHRFILHALARMNRNDPVVALTARTDAPPTVRC